MRLEAEGVTSSVSQSRYGFRDVWSMAEAFLPVAQAQKAVESSDVKNSYISRDYLKGVSFAAPLICCCLAMLLLKVSLWGGSLTGNEAAAIAIATVSSFVVTGGFIQIIGRQGHFYKENKEWGLCSRCCWSFYKAGFLTLAICLATGFLGNAYFGWLPFSLFVWCAAFHLGIGSYLLISGVLYVLDGELLVTLGTLVGIGIAVVLRLEFQIPLLISQIAGIAGAAFICILFALFRFQRLGCRPFEGAKLPSIGKLVYLLWPYFAYGCLYYLFLFADRFIAWSAHTQSASLPLEFRGEYETALDICLFAFIVQVGWIQAGLVKFYWIATTEQKRFRLNARDKLKKALATFYHRQLLIFSILFILSTAAVIFAIHWFDILRAMLVLRVALLGLAGIPLLVIGLWNIALLFALSRPRFVLIAVAWAFLLDVCVGYVLSRLFSYDLAIVGFDIGACALACVSGWFCRRLLADFDYHYFAATV